MGDEATHVLVPGGARVAYRLIGTGRRPLILVHGWMMSGAVFDDFVDALDTSEFRVVLPDLVGTGRSDRPSTGYALTRYAADVLAVLEHAVQESDLARPIVVGHSMGGQIAQLVAAAMPDTLHRLVLINPVPLSGMELPQEARDLFRTSAGDRAKLSVILDMASKELTSESHERLLALALDVSEACIIESFDAWTAGGFEQRLADIGCPTLVVATDDPFLPEAFLKAAVVDLISKAEMRYLAGPGHYPLVERASATAALVADYLAD